MDYKEKVETLNQILEGYEDHAYLLDGYEDALVGYDYKYPTKAIYDSDKCIKILMKRDKMSFDDALEYFEYNTIRSLDYIPEHNRPIILSKFSS
jgi:hypothetical protein